MKRLLALIFCIVILQMFWVKNLMAINGDVNANGKLGLEDCIAILQTLSGAKITDEEGTIKCGDSLTGIIGDIGETDDFTFYAWAGEVILIAVENQSTSALFKPCWQLLDSAENAVTAIGDQSWDTSCEGDRSYKLPNDGQYTIRIYDNENDATGNYRVRLEPVSAYFNGELSCAKPITCGETQYGTLESKYSAGSYIFSAKAGEVIALAVENRSTSSLFQPCWHLLDPSADAITAIGDQSWDTSCEGNRSYKLPNDGPFMVRIYDDGRDGKGDYSIRLEPVSAYFNGVLSCANQVEYEKTYSGTLESNHAIDTYMFFEQGGETVEISVTNLSSSVLFQPCWQLLNKSIDGISAVDDQSWVTISCETTKSYNIPEDGYFIIRIFDSDQDGKGDYEITLKKF